LISTHLDQFKIQCQKIRRHISEDDLNLKVTACNPDRLWVKSFAKISFQYLIHFFHLFSQVI